MRPITLLWIVCLLQGSCAVKKFVQRGQDVRLELQEPVQLRNMEELTWRFMQIYELIMVSLRYGQVPWMKTRYRGHFEFSVQDYSLLLKNLQLNQSGVYTALYEHKDLYVDDITVATYTITVQEPVSPVDLKVTSVSSSEDSCNLTVTCTTLGSHINTTFRCDYHTCYKEHETSEIPTTNSLEVYWSHGLIICNHSNQVSWTNKSMEVKPHCKSPGSFQGAVEKFEGEDVLLELQGLLPSEFYDFRWIITTSINKYIVFKVRCNSSTIINPRYAGRVEFSDQNFSLRLKNLQVNDGGVYTAGYEPVNIYEPPVILAEYKVTVQDLSPVDLKVTSVSSSEDSCHLIVTCTTLDSHIISTFRCNNYTCYKEHDSSDVTTTNSLEVYWSHGSIICNHSNLVRRTNKSMDMKPPCKSPVIPPQPGSPVGLIVGIIIAVAVCGGVCGGVYFHKKRGKSADVEAAGDTVYANVMNQGAHSDTIISSLAMSPLAPVPAE